MDSIIWEKGAEEKFKKLVEKIPPFMRGIAGEKVSKRAQALVSEAGRMEITEKDLVDAFFKETPGGFHGVMKADMEEIGVDYTQYGYEKDEWKNIFGSKKDEPKR